MWEEVRGFCFSPQEGSRAEETISPSAPPPAAPIPSTKLCGSRAPSLSECHTTTTTTTTTALPPHYSPYHWLRCKAAHPRHAFPPSLTVHHEGAGEGCTPGSWVPPSQLLTGLACSVFSGDQPWWAGVRDRELPCPSPGKPQKNVYMPNRM